MLHVPGGAAGSGPDFVDSIAEGGSRRAPKPNPPQRLDASEESS